MAQPSGSWRGSYMREDDIERLVRLRRIPAGVITRAPGVEMEPRPEPGERVVFGAHLDRGLGLPASNFFRRFLDFFGLQPHHLPANAFILLSCYVAFMEGYAGLWPDVEFWSRLFYIKTQTTEGHLRTCGAASIYPRTAFNRLNLPEYNPAPPVGRLNWGHNPRTTDPDAEVNLLWDFLGECVTGGRLTAEDLLCTYTERRVLPLQRRVHKIGHMSGRLDPTRTSKLELTKAQVARRVNNITKANMSENWNWGLPPYDRASPPELLFDRQGVEAATREDLDADHVDPATSRRPSAAPLPVVRTKAAGEHNPPPSNEPERKAGGVVRDLSTAVPCARGRLAPRRLLHPRGGSEPAAGPRPSWRLRPRSSAGWSPRRAAIKFTQGGGSRPPPRAEPTLSRQRRESTPQSSMRAPPVVIVPPAGTSSAAPPSAAPGRGAQGEPVHRPTLDEMFPRRAPLLGPAAGAGRGAPPATGAGAGGAAPPDTGAGASGAAPPEAGAGGAAPPEGTHPTPEKAAPTGPPRRPPRPEPSREERPGRSRQGRSSAPKDADSGRW
ncbi:hypothetical protein QYE76_069994 [Lolium multiflorum]|uniref:Transposase (putative) gypsy type domain-containing protein n=1 Tax=Lolium multiflorum TaxID=4521 RepID=A0AAD8WFG0_LOLMU|nr:hypothetical protein QYE76_069994 [Lolium multiflorum]